MLNGSLSGAGTSMLRASQVQDAATGGSPLGIEVQSRWLPSDSFEVDVNIQFIDALPSGNYGLFIAIVEKNIDYNAPNGEDKHRNVFRAMLPSSAGEVVPLLSAGMTTGFFTYRIAKHPDWEQSEIEAIAFVQNMDNNEVINAGAVGSFTTSISPEVDPGITLSPNPAQEQVRITWSSTIGRFLN